MNLVERGKCSDPECNEPAVGKVWVSARDDKTKSYCRKHLEKAKKLGHPIKLFSDTDITAEE